MPDILMPEADVALESSDLALVPSDLVSSEPVLALVALVPDLALVVLDLEYPLLPALLGCVQIFAF